jgi:Kdo2-lipid IVA lauroyltransferase/acyltransferase
MTQPRSPLLDRIAYLAVRTVGAVLQMFPPAVGCRIGDRIARLVSYFDRRHRAVALDNLRHAFPDRPEAELRRLVRDVYGHLGELLAELLYIPRKWHARTIDRYVTAPDRERLAGAIRSGRPVLVVTAHVGNWEALGYWLGLSGFAGEVVARPLDNPHLDRVFRQFRERTGNRLLAKHGDFDKMRRVLAGGGLLYTLTDQDAGPRGLFVEYFGRPASTHKVAAFLARRSGATVVVLGTRRVGSPLRHEFRVTDVIPKEEYERRPDATAALTRRVTAAVERLVRLDPRQYLWLHRRWKTQPPVQALRVSVGPVAAEDLDRRAGLVDVVVGLRPVQVQVAAAQVDQHRPVEPAG